MGAFTDEARLSIPGSDRVMRLLKVGSVAQPDPSLLNETPIVVAYDSAKVSKWVDSSADGVGPEVAEIVEEVQPPTAYRALLEISRSEGFDQAATELFTDAERAFMGEGDRIAAVAKMVFLLIRERIRQRRETSLG